MSKPSSVFLAAIAGVVLALLAGCSAVGPPAWPSPLALTSGSDGASSSDGLKREPIQPASLQELAVPDEPLVPDDVLPPGEPGISDDTDPLPLELPETIDLLEVPPPNEPEMSDGAEIVPPGEPQRIDYAEGPPRHSGDVCPIDLGGALALGGANNLQIRLVRERVHEAQLKLAEARIMWIPSLRGGIGYNRHDGRLQATEGEVINANRNSMFLGGGAALGRSSIAGGGGGPSRLVVDLALADVWFERLVARQKLRAECAGHEATVNDTLLAVALAYFDLLESHGLLADAETGLEAADQMVDLTTKYAAEGMLSQSEVARAKTARELLKQAVEDARRRTVGRSAELVRLLHLQHETTLVPLDEHVAAVEIVDESIPVEQLLDEGLCLRPELRQYRHLAAAVGERVGQERWRPWLPHLAVGVSAGTFGGGQSGRFANQAGRADFDALAVWELRNLGAGNSVLRRQRTSQHRQAYLAFAAVRDRIIAEITTAATDVASYHRQIDSAAAAIESANQSHLANLRRIKQGEGLPIELLQAIRAQVDALDAYTKAVSNYNRAQFELLRAVGEPPRCSGWAE